MRLVLHSRAVYFLGAGLLIVIALALLLSSLGKQDQQLITATVERGDVTELVSVSGVVKAQNTAMLAFPLGGTVRLINVDEGDVVQAGDVLAQLELRTLNADRLDAIAQVQKARAERDELLAGPRSESRAVTETSVAIKEDTLEQTKKEQSQKIENARRTLLSSDLTAVADDPNEPALAPTITGSYNCDEEGIYLLDVYRSAAESGYSYSLSGLESGTFSASVDQPTSLGSCGLRIQFDDESRYTGSIWTVSVPNIESSFYITNLNNYELTLDQAQTAIESAERALTLANQESTLVNADPRIEAQQRANATIAQAEARLARVNAQIEERTIRAPFSGTITNVNIIAGESAGTSPVITLLAEDTFELTARIPEIDITKLSIGQEAVVTFDARDFEPIIMDIIFINPIAVEIDGVAYYEAILDFPNVPEWIRSGLNADIDIVTEKQESVLRLPLRFVSETNGQHFVQTLSNEKVASSTIEVGLRGNDGYIEVKSLNEGDTVVAP